MGTPKCSIENCKNKPLKIKFGYCSTHYYRYHMYGAPDAVLRPNHGLSKTAAYRSWTAMKTRTSNPKSSDYSYYGGRGIKVCERWLGAGGFLRFLEDMGQPPHKGDTLDRVDVNGNYEPNNCKWASRLEQANNARSNYRVTYKGKTQTLAQWGVEKGLDKNLLYRRYHTGWSVEEMLETQPVVGRNQYGC